MGCSNQTTAALRLNTQIMKSKIHNKLYMTKFLLKSVPLIFEMAQKKKMEPPANPKKNTNYVCGEGRWVDSWNQR